MTTQTQTRTAQAAAALQKNGAAGVPAQKSAMPTTIDGMLKDERFKGQIAAALPSHVSPDRISRIALTEVRKNPVLRDCDPISLFGCIMQASQLGLELGGALGHAYLVPFRDRKNNRMDAQFIVGYRGMIDLARRSGQIVSLQAHEVYEGDLFDFAYGLDERLEHVPCRDPRDRGPVVFFYAVAKLKGGGYQMEVMSKADVDAVRAQSKAGQSGPWVSHYVEMGKKTVIRRLFKYLPVSVELSAAVGLDEAADRGAQANRDWLDGGSVGSDFAYHGTRSDDDALDGVDAETGEVVGGAS